MPAVACEDAFMNDLLADLDSESLFLPPSSSQPRLNPTPTRRKRPATAPAAPARVIPSTRAVPPRREGDGGVHQNKRIATLREGVLSPKRVNISPKPNESTKGVQIGSDRGGDRLSREMGSLSEGKENEEIKPRLSSKSRGKQPMKVSEAQDLMEAIDWDIDDTIDEESSKKPSYLSQDYLRGCVEEVNELEIDGIRRKSLIISSKAFEGTREVLLFDDWIETQIEFGDMIHLVGDFEQDPLDKSIISINRSHGLLILHPDILVSSTKVADSSHCTRKAVLQEIVRSTSTPTPSLAFGNMLHELMQRCLMENQWEADFTNQAIDDIVTENNSMLWSMELTGETAKVELLERSKEFSAFAERFVGSTPKLDAFLLDSRVSDISRPRLAIVDGLAVEEDIWSPRYGLKGKIDASLSSNIVDSSGTQSRQTLPFEIKTGRAIAGMEHRAQTMLYTLLMSDRYNEKIRTGLLHYTQSNETHLVQSAHNELRGLINARNRFATLMHLRTKPPLESFSPSSTTNTIRSQTLVDSSEEDLWNLVGSTPDANSQRSTTLAPENLDLALLPPPIDEERSCRNCYVSDACMVFRRASEGQTSISDDVDDPLQVIYEQKTGHLTEQHAEFFRKWEDLIRFEEREMVKFKKEIWTMSAIERAETGRCLANMRIDESYKRPNSQFDKIQRFVYRFSRHPISFAATQASSRQDSEVPLGGAFTLNDPVVVSLEDPPVLALARGFVLSLTSEAIVIGLDHSLTDYPQTRNVQVKNLVFRIDKDELAAGMGRIRDNLLQLFVAGGDERRRQLIVDLEIPRFDLPVRNRLIPSHLNSDQQEALKKVLSARDYALVLGMPGTGKTTLIAELLKVLVKSNLSVLLTSYTHSAVDNILLKIKDDDLDILRLGNRDKIIPSLHAFTLSPEDCSKSFAEIDNKLMRPKIVATTCLGINEAIFLKRRFDVCIVDEASQVTLPTCIGPLRFADKFVLVGDHNQLPPLVRNPEARRGGLDISLFKRLAEAHPNAVSELTLQYRMNDDIMTLCNELVYEGHLKVGNDEISQRKLHLPDPKGMSEVEDWLNVVLDPSRRVIFVDTDNLPARERRTLSLIDNETEAQIVLKIVETLVKCGVTEEAVGVVTLYRQQVHLLERKLQAYPEVEVLTADRSQGRDKECIVISCVRSNEAGQVGELLKDWRRINVCLSRAKSKLVVIGSRSTLSQVDVLRRFFDIIDERKWGYNLPQTSLLSFEGEVATSSEKSVRKENRGTRQKPLSEDILNSLG